MSVAPAPAKTELTNLVQGECRRWLQHRNVGDVCRTCTCKNGADKSRARRMPTLASTSDLKIVAHKSQEIPKHSCTHLCATRPEWMQGKLWCYARPTSGGSTQALPT